MAIMNRNSTLLQMTCEDLTFQVVRQADKARTFWNTTSLIQYVTKNQVGKFLAENNITEILCIQVS